MNDKKSSLDAFLERFKDNIKTQKLTEKFEKYTKEELFLALGVSSTLLQETLDALQEMYDQKCPHCDCHALAAKLLNLQEDVKLVNTVTKSTTTNEWN